MRVGICSATFRDKKIDEIIGMVEKAGLNYIEWASDTHLYKLDMDTAKYIREKCQSKNIEVSYGSYFKFLTDDFEEYAKTAQALGAKNIRVWARRKWSYEFTKSEYDEFILQIKENAEIAKKYGLNLCFENHRKSFTDNRYSILTMLNDVNKDNVFSYWQPQAGESLENRIETIKFLKNYVNGVHVFNWDDDFNRYELGLAKNEWKSYIKELGTEKVYLLEFIKNDDILQFYRDAEVLKELLDFDN